VYDAGDLPIPGAMGEDDLKTDIRELRRDLYAHREQMAAFLARAFLGM
jgi:hypothetical protein